MNRSYLPTALIQAISLLMVVIAIPFSARAFGVQKSEGGYSVSWPGSSILFEVNASGSSDISDGSDFTALRRGVSSWNTITCSTVTLNEGSTTSETDTLLTTNYTDGVNRLTWVEDSRWQWGAYVLGVTAPVSSYYGEIGEADIAFNGYATSWETDGQGRYTDIESVAVHELGHFIGIQHVLNGAYADDPPTMSPSVDPYLRTRSLSPDDRSAACFLYPSTTSGYSCAADCDCPAIVVNNGGGQEYNDGRMVCDASSECVEGSGTTITEKQISESCAPGQCTGSLFCQDTGGYGSFCSQTCDPNAQNCPTGLDCFGFANSNEGACLPSDFMNGGGGGETCLVNQGGTNDPDAEYNGSGGGNNTGGGGNTGGTNQPSGPCACDDTYYCDADPNNEDGDIYTSASDVECSCDPECPCVCDTTTACDADCDCDPDCGKGCATSIRQTNGAAHLVVIMGFWLALVILRRRVLRAHG